MKKRLSKFINSNFSFALKVHIIACIISLFTIILLSFINSVVITIAVACFYFLSGIYLFKRDASLLSLFSILLCIYLLGVLDVLVMFFYKSTTGVLPEFVNFLYLIFSDPLQLLNVLPLSPILFLIFIILLPFFPILLMYAGKKALGHTGLVAKLDNLMEKIGAFRKPFYVIVAIILLANIYFVYSPKIFVEYNNSDGFAGFEELLTIDESGDYNYVKTNCWSNAKKEIKLKLTRNEMRQVAFGIVYKSMFFKLRPDLSVYNKTDQSSEAIKVKWFGNTKEVYGYGIENLLFHNITSRIKVKINDYYKDNYKYGYIDKNEGFEIYPKYNYAISFRDDFAYVRENDKEYYINKSGIEVPESAVNYVSKQSSSPKLIKGYDGYGFVNNEGKLVIGHKYHLAQDFSEGLAAVWDENHDWVYIDEQEQKVIKIDFAKTGNSSMGIRDLSGFHEGLAWIKWNNKYGYIDKNGQMVIQPIYDVTTDFSEGLACINLNGKWGYIDRNGKYVIEPKFDMAFPFSDGLGCVRIGDEENGKWGYLDKTGKFIIDAKFNKAEPFAGGLACVMIDLTQGEVDKENKYKLK